MVSGLDRCQPISNGIFERSLYVVILEADDARSGLSLIKDISFLETDKQVENSRVQHYCITDESTV
jgi:hypothetical protein